MRRSGAALERLLFLLAAIALGFGYAPAGLGDAAFDPARKHTDVLRVVTWNVGEGVAEGASALRPRNVAHVVDVLRELRPDLVLLQEVAGGDQAEALRAALGPGWIATLPSEVGAVGRCVVTLAPRGTFLPMPYGQRTARRHLTRFNLDQRLMTVANVHADAFAAEERNAMLGYLADRLPRGEPCLLGGDLNLDLDLDKRRDLFTDDSHKDVETYNYLARDLEDFCRTCGATADPDRRLDYLFASPMDFMRDSGGVVRGRRSGAMDHDPLVVDLLFRH